MTAATSRTLLATAMVMALALALVAGLDHPIQNLNEGLYARIAQEMLERGSWIVPTLDGVPYLEKPPLMYWLTAAAFAAFGVADWSARTAPLLGSVLMLASVYALALRRLDRRSAGFAVAILASCPLFVGLGHTLLFDALFTGLLSASLVTLHEALVAERAARWMRASAALLALAVLTKGLAALVFYIAIAGVVVIAARGRDERREFARRLADPVAAAIFLALAVPWHVMVWMREPQFGWFYFVNEHVMRFLGRRVPHDFHTGPAWYYLPRMAGYALPWILLLALPRTKRAAPTGLARGFLAAWILVPLLVFSASGAKGDYYMIVGLPPLALLLAHRVAGLRDARWLAIVPLGWLVALTALAAAAGAVQGPVQLPEATVYLLAAAFACAGFSLTAALRGRCGAAVAASATVALPLALLYSGYIAANEDARSARRLAEAIERHHVAAVFTFRDYEKVSALTYYLRRPVGVIDSRSLDLWFGMKLEPDAARFPSTQRFASVPWRVPVAVVVMDSALQDFRASPFASRLVALGTFGDAHLFASLPVERLARAPTTSLAAVTRVHRGD